MSTRSSSPLRLLAIILWLGTPPLSRAAPPPAKVIHAFVALCDNDSQGIAPVPKKIGNGDDPGNNLYWGCDDGLRAVFASSKAWQKITTPALDPDGSGPILERLVFRHKATGAILVGDAYRGREIKACLTDYFAALAGRHPVTVNAGDTELAAGGAAQLVAYLGHNGLMEFTIDGPPPTPEATASPRTAIALCCVSQRYFKAPLATAGARPLLLTRQLMYPAAQLLHEASAGWLAGRTPDECAARAAAAYAANQKISHKAAAGVFAAE